MKPKDKYVAPIHSYYRNLQREIDDADWIGDTERAEFLEQEEREVKAMIDKGELYYPFF